jgi:hypothetical protein
MNFLTLHFSATFCHSWPKIRILIDHNVIEELYFDGPVATATVPVDLCNGDHTLLVERYDKTQNNVVFVDGKILQDQAVTLESMYVDNVKLSDLFLYHGKFCYDNNVLPGVLTWGPNGQWLWEFQTPLLPWLIDLKNSGVDSPDMVVPNLDNINKLKKDIQDFKQSWQ